MLGVSLVFARLLEGVLRPEELQCFARDWKMHWVHSSWFISCNHNDAGTLGTSSYNSQPNK
jgi:hypothetical protein